MHLVLLIMYSLHRCCTSIATRIDVYSYASASY